jgi:hypothetical protein
LLNTLNLVGEDSISSVHSNASHDRMSNQGQTFFLMPRTSFKWGETNKTSQIT